MTTEAKVSAALTGSTGLVALLANGKSSIYHNISKDAGTYPVCVYAITGINPHQHSDNACSARLAIVRVWVISDTGALSELSNQVTAAMLAAGFMWQQSTDGHEDNYFFRAMDFTIAEEVLV